MNSRNRLIVVATILQILMVVSGHYEIAIRNLSGILGVGIPLIVGFVYGLRGATSTRDSLFGGALIGLVGAVLGILLAILLGDQPWLLLTFGPVSSAITGLLGGWLGYALAGRR